MKEKLFKHGIAVNAIAVLAFFAVAPVGGSAKVSATRVKKGD